MTDQLEAFQAMLRQMRNAFLDELSERCDSFEDEVLALEKQPQNQEAFESLYRGVHSLKGSGGTHGLGIITTVCHQLENLLSASAANQAFDEVFTSRALAHIDLLRRTETPARQPNPDFSDIERDLEALQNAVKIHCVRGLIAEASPSLASVYRNAVDSLANSVTQVNNGLEALAHLVREPYDFAIIGRELKELNGIAVLGALRLSQTRNQNMPVIFITGNRDSIPAHLKVESILSKDVQLLQNLRATVQNILQGRDTDRAAP